MENENKLKKIVEVLDDIAVPVYAASIACYWFMKKRIDWCSVIGLMTFGVAKELEDKMSLIFSSNIKRRCWACV